MTTLQISLLMGVWPIIYFLIYTAMHRSFAPVQRIVTTALQRKEEVIAVGCLETRSANLYQAIFSRSTRRGHSPDLT